MPKRSITRMIALELIQHPPDHDRQRDEENIERLKRSINLLGLFNPITVVPNGQTFYVVAGFHRLAACRRLGHAEINCTVLDESTSEADALAISVAENHVRQNESFSDTVRRLEQIMKLEGCSFSEAARKSGTNRSFASKCQQCEKKLCPAAKQLINGNRDKLGISIAYQVATKARSREQQIELLQALINGKLTRDGIAEWVSESRSPKPSRTALRVACDDVEISLSVPKATEYETLLAAVGHLKSRLVAEKKHGTPIHVLPEILG